MIDKILCAGYGGQGIVLAGSLIANAALAQGLEACGMVSYGAEIRGGTATATCIISDEKIGSPVVVNPTSAIIMNQLSLDAFGGDIVKDGLLIINTSECSKKPLRKDIKIFDIPATKLAEELGNKRVANLIMVGKYLRERNIVSLDNAIKAIPFVLKGKSELVEINKKALRLGYGD